MFIDFCSLWLYFFIIQWNNIKVKVDKSIFLLCRNDWESLIDLKHNIKFFKSISEFMHQLNYKQYYKLNINKIATFLILYYDFRLKFRPFLLFKREIIANIAFIIVNFLGKRVFCKHVKPQSNTINNFLAISFVNLKNVVSRKTNLKLYVVFHVLLFYIQCFVSYVLLFYVLCYFMFIILCLTVDFNYT